MIILNDEIKSCQYWWLTTELVDLEYIASNVTDETKSYQYW